MNFSVPTVNPLTNIYKSFEEKDEFIYLTRKIITEHDVDLLFGWLQKVKQQGIVIFRGLGQSHYKHYSHSQRQFAPLINCYNSHELFYELILDTVEYAKKWNNGTLKNYLKARGIEGDLFAYLSLMQHFGIPTPLIDFTKNPYVALYFATAKQLEQNSGNEINDFCSLYYINKEYPYLKIYRNHFINTIKVNLKDGYTREKAYFYGIRFTPQLIIDGDDELFKIVNNINIINQEGIFIMNGDSNQPLEDQHDLQKRIYIDQLKQKGMNYSGSQKMFGCWEIHKSLNDLIRERLNKDHGINHKFLFPEMGQCKIDFKTEFKYPTNLDASLDGSYWKNRERAVKSGN